MMAMKPVGLDVVRMCVAFSVNEDVIGRYLRQLEDDVVSRFGISVAICFETMVGD